MSALVRSIAALVLAVVALSGCRTVEKLIAPSPTPEPICFGMGEVADGPPHTIELMAGLGERMVFVARVTAPGEARFNTEGAVPVGSEAAMQASVPLPIIVTVHPVTIERVLDGDATGVEGIATRGGTVGCATFEAHPIIDLRAGGRYLVWLRPGMFIDETPDPAHPLVSDAWPVGPTGMIATPHDGSVSIDDLVTRLAVGG
jgi:hypothetical protein